MELPNEDQLECIDESTADVVDADMDAGAEGDDEKQEGEEKTADKESEKKPRIFDNDRFTFSGQCETCSAGLLEDKDHVEFLIERCCAPTRSYFYRNALVKHWPDFQGLVTNMQPYCGQCKKHFWGLPDLTRHMFNMTHHGVDDIRVLKEENPEEEKKEEKKPVKEVEKPEETPEKAMDETTGGNEDSKKNPSGKNRTRLKRRRQVRGEAVQEELQRRLKRAEEVAASLPEEEIPNEEQRETNKRTHAPLLETLYKIIKMGSSKEPPTEVIELLNEIICVHSPRWFEASYLMNSFEGVNLTYMSAAASNDMASGRTNVALLEARWRRARDDTDEATYSEMTEKLNEQGQLSTADRERALRRIAENGDLWKDDECSPPGDTFTCLVCDRKGRSLRIHLDEALWLTNVSAPSSKSIDLPDCPIAVEASLADMRNNPVMAHVYHYLGEENTRRLVEELSFKSNRVLRCPACKFHFRALRCSLPVLFSHLQSCGFMKVESDFKDAHHTVALRISSLLAEARSGFRSTPSIVDELVDFLSCNEGGLHFQRRGAVTMQSLKANPRLMAKIRRAVQLKIGSEEAAKNKNNTKKETSKQTSKGSGGAAASGTSNRDPLRGVAQTKQMKKKPSVMARRAAGTPSGFRTNGIGGGSGGSYLLGAHVPTNIRSAPAGRLGGFSGGMLGGMRSSMDMGSSTQVGVYCEMCSKEFYGYSFMEANRFLHTHLMDALFRSRREPGQAKMAAQHLKCFSSSLVYSTMSTCPACRITRGSLDGTLHHITQLASSNDITAVQHMNIANEVVTKFIDCMNGTMSLTDLSMYIRRRFLS